MQSIPFSITGSFTSLFNTAGYFSFRENNVTLEYQSMDKFLGILKSGVNQRQVPVEEIDTIYLDKKLCKAIIIIKSKKINYFENFPGSWLGEIRLKIKKKYCEYAESIIKEIEYAMSEKKLFEIEEQMK